MLYCRTVWSNWLDVNWHLPQNSGFMSQESVFVFGIFQVACFVRYDTLLVHPLWTTQSYRVARWDKQGTVKGIPTTFLGGAQQENSCWHFPIFPTQIPKSAANVIICPLILWLPTHSHQDGWIPRYIFFSNFHRCLSCCCWHLISGAFYSSTASARIAAPRLITAWVSWDLEVLAIKVL